VPTVPQLIERLGGHGLTRSGVNFHIDYLARTKLKVKPAECAGKADWPRVALINLALRFDLVEEPDLRLGHPRFRCLGRGILSQDSLTKGVWPDGRTGITFLV
jgi:hypothetical protein